MSRPFSKRLVTYLLALIGGIAGGLILWLVTGFIADFLLGLGGMSAREGGRAMFAFFAVAPFGALAGFALGVWLVLHYQGGYRSVADIAGGLLLVALGAVALVSAGTGVLYLSDDQLAKNSLPPQAKFELRFPAHAKLPDQLQDLSIHLQTDKNTQPARWLTEIGYNGDRLVIVGEVDLAFRTTHRILVVQIKGEPDRLFMLNLAGNPAASPEFGPWQRVDFIDDQPPQAPRKGGAGDEYEIRYRVERAD